MLELDSVRHIAQSEGHEEIYFNDTSKVVSFARNGIRINVYWTTGTVGTCLTHPRQGKTQLFRRKADLTLLREIFRDPRVHTGSGYHRVGQQDHSSNERRRINNGYSTVGTFSVGDRVYVTGHAEATVRSGILLMGTSNYPGRIKVECDDGQILHVTPDQLVPAGSVQDEEAEIAMEMQRLETAEEDIENERKQLELAANELKVEKSKLMEILNDIKENRRKKAEQMAAEKARLAEIAAQKITEEIRATRGNFVKFLAFEADHVNKIFNKTVTCVACGGLATIMLYEYGDWAFTSNLPKLLHNKLNGRQKWLPKPLYVALGSQNRYYIRFEDGKSEFVGCDRMVKTLQKKQSSAVRTVAFGDDWDSYFIVYSDGDYAYSNIPHALRKLLVSRNNKRDLVCVSLGSSGEYYVRRQDERAWWGGMSTKNLQAVSSVKDRMTFLDFGDDNTYFLRYK
jgi:hypothetical protein